MPALSDDPAAISPVALDSSGLQLAAVATREDGANFVVFDLQTGREQCRLLGAGDRVGHLSFSPDGRRIITREHRGLLTLWDAMTGQELLNLDAPPVLSSGLENRELRLLIPSPDGKSLAGDGEFAFGLWRLEAPAP